MAWPRAVLVLAAALVLATAAGAQQIGVVASREPDLRGTPPGQATRILGVGAPVVAQETIASSPSGRGQLMFTDRTTLTLSPNSEIVLDRFVFDPEGGGSSAGLRLTRGALRFIGGQATRQQEAEIRTPTLIIGIRGSSALVSYEAGRTRAILIAGDRMCAGQGDARTCTNRQGAILTEDGYAGQVTQQELGRILAEVDGPPRRGAAFGTGAAGGGASGAGVRDGLTGIRGESDPRGAPVSSRGEQRAFEVFDEAERSEAVREILSSRTAPGFIVPAPPQDTDTPEPEMPEPEMPEPEMPEPEMPEPEMPEPEMPEPEMPEPEMPEPEMPEPEMPEPEMPEPEMPEPEMPEPVDPDGPVIEVDPL